MIQLVSPSPPFFVNFHMFGIDPVFRLQENTFSRFVESFKKQFAERELVSLLARTAVREGGPAPRCICMVACSPDDDSEVVGTLDLRPPAAATGVPPPSVPEACGYPPPVTPSCSSASFASEPPGAACAPGHHDPQMPLQGCTCTHTP